MRRVVCSRFTLLTGSLLASPRLLTHRTCSAQAAEAQAAPKRAIVFGGTSGIGLATSLRLRDKGVDVLAVSRSGAPSAEAAESTGIRFGKCDVTDKDDICRLFEEQGAVDILISTATGGARAKGPFLEMDMAAYQGSFAKLWGYANVVRFGTEHVREGGAIVLVSGFPARRPQPGQVALASVGGAVEQLARTIAPELAARKVRINVVSPGIISTPMFGGSAGRDDLLAPAVRNFLIPRVGTAEEVAHAIMFAVENEFITGTTIDVDGGAISRL